MPVLARIAALVALLFALGCSGERRYSLEMPAHLDLSALDSEHAARMLAAADAWAIATDGGVSLTEGQGYAVPVTMATLPGMRIGETRNKPDADTYMRLELDDKGGAVTPELQLWAGMHELGHALGLQHAQAGLMTPAAEPGPPCVDAAALALVCATYACGPGAHATCD